MYKTEWILEGGSNCCLNFALNYNSNNWIGILPMVFWPSYPWYFDPLPMVYRNPYPWYIPWYIDPPTHGISTPLPMVFWPLYPWYIDPPTHGILTPLPMMYRPPIHGILTPLPIDIRPPTHDILASLPISWLGMGVLKYHGASIYHGAQNTVWRHNIFVFRG
jgi:hypothetical protein